MERELGLDINIGFTNDFGEPGLPGVGDIVLPHEQVVPGAEMGIESHGRHGGRGGRSGGGAPRVVVVLPESTYHPAFDPDRVGAPVSRSKIDAQHRFLRDLRDDVAIGAGSGLLSPLAQLVIGREIERGATRTLGEDKFVVPTDWLSALPEHQQLLEEYRKSHLEAANYKRSGTGWTPEDLSKNTGLDRVRMQEAENLYRHYPGLRQTMELYVQITRGHFVFTHPTKIDGEGDLRRFTLETAEDYGEVNIIRNYITGRLIEVLEQARVRELTRTGLGGAEIRALYREGLITGYARMQARAAEQLALNMLYAADFWEWEGWVASDVFMNLPIRSAHRPMDAFVSLALSGAKNPNKLTNTGVLGTWINNFLVESFRRAYGSDLEDLQMRDIIYEPVPETGGNWRKFWTVGRRRDGKCVVRVPEGLPIVLLKGAMQEKGIADLLEQGRDINWAEYEGVYSIFKYRLGSGAGPLWDFLRGKKETKDMAGLAGVLSVLGKSDDFKLKRWVNYLYSIFDVHEQAPRISFGEGRYGRTLKKEYIISHSFGKKGMRYLEPNQVLFPWN